MESHQPVDYNGLDFIIIDFEHWEVKQMTVPNVLCIRDACIIVDLWVFLFSFWGLGEGRSVT